MVGEQENKKCPLLMKKIEKNLLSFYAFRTVVHQ
jgi:hypothetical protein